jgi:D-3-phosphoglycerate dehydrogenase
LPEVSDFAIALMMTLLRHIPTYDQHVREGIWDISSILTKSGYPEMRRLSSQTIGIFGFGKIAQEVAKKVKAFGFEILVVDPYMKEDYVKDFGAKLVSLEELLKKSDVITIHSPLTPETKYIFNKEAFEKMKDNAILINTARGPLVNESDLYYALKNKIIAGAALDVTENEPLESDSPLRELENIIITPHAAFFTKDSYYELRERAAKEVLRVLSGGKAKSKVN